MIVKEFMTKDIEVISPDSTVKDAAGKMKSLNVGMLPVCDGEKLKGVITDRDIVVKAIAEGKDPNATEVQNIISEDMRICFDDEGVEEAAKRMKTKQIRRLPVLSRNKRLVGVVSLGDIAVRVNEELAGDVLEKVSEPSKPEK
ncbi:MAG: CBS domain-containing protein [Candidatus Omnitrophica bacterium]|nr:CBS domain-containing protein [Candidatus Omnitrophota bacterium]MBD3268816.1 CBS domain-containing protein [Candidatus Omnitrophota bacterium]